MSAAIDGAIDELVERYGLGPDAAPAFATLLAVLAEDDAAPTTVRDPRRALDVHLADSLSGLDVPAVRAARRIADLGAGAGFPGLVLAAALPAALVTLVESAGRKCAFIARAAEAAGIGNADVVHARAEEWREGAGACDLVTARALAPLAVIAEYAAPLLAEHGSLVAWKGAVEGAEERAAAVAAEDLGLELRDRLRVIPFPAAERRTLYV